MQCRSWQIHGSALLVGQKSTALLRLTRGIFSLFLIRLHLLFPTTQQHCWRLLITHSENLEKYRHVKQMLNVLELFLIAKSSKLVTSYRYYILPEKVCFGWKRQRGLNSKQDINKLSESITLRLTLVFNFNFQKSHKKIL